MEWGCRKINLGGGTVMKKSLLVLITFAAFLVATAPALADPLEGMKSTVWRYQCANALGTTDSKAAEVFKAEIEKRTNGLLKVEIYPSSGLNIPLTKMVSAVRDGLLEMGECIGGFVHGELFVSDVGQFWGDIPDDLEGKTVACQATRPFFERILPANYNQYFLGSIYGSAMNISVLPVSVLETIF
jgi:hypothetical protein